VPSRRELLAGVAGSVSVTAGCLGSDDLVARCASRGRGSDGPHLRRVLPIRGDERIALGVMVSEQAVTDDAFGAISVRDSDEHLVASIPLLPNREMSSLDPADYSAFSSSSGELYALPLGRPPVHGAYTVSLVGPDDDPVETERIRFNCYAEGGELP
jgi:hypothetical protein